jgi:hypothetical protein
VLAIGDGELLEGQLKASKLRLVQAWVESHREELEADWQLASQGQAIFGIDPLK